jgi:hypothetical protein
MNGFKLQRLGMVMEPEPGNPQEVEGVLNPVARSGPDGELTSASDWPAWRALTCWMFCHLGGIADSPQAKV